MSGSHNAPEPERDARYDCRTLIEQERDDVAALRARLEAQDARIAALAELGALRDRRPHSLKWLYGRRGPTLEQRAAYEEQVREWNRQYRAAQKRYKAAQ